MLAPWRHDDTPGCALGVDREGVPLLRRAVGMASLEAERPWTIGTISESGSVAKQFVAAGLVLLALDGKLALDDDISRWIPEVRGIGRRITIRHLLTHTSGLPDRYLLHEVEGRAAGEVDHPNAEVMHVVSRLRDLNFDPGDDYLYSNTGYVVAVAVLERVSGRSLQQLTDERIFRPLGMASTRWREDHRVVVPGRAAAYSGVRAGGFRNDHPFTRVFGSGGLLTTVDDFLKWQAALQRGAGSWGAVRDSLEVAGRLNDGTVLAYGLGVGVGTWRGSRVVSHTGSTGGYRAANFRGIRVRGGAQRVPSMGATTPHSFRSPMTAPPAYFRPEAAECAPFHLAYVGKVPEGDILQTMERQLHETTALLETVPAGKADFAYAPGKWTIKQVVGHVMDAERIFAYRALRIGRGDSTPLPGFDENLYVPASGAEHRSLIDLLAEFHAVRRATLALFHHLPAEAATRTGIVGGATVSVRALAWVITGHERHHLHILRERYLA